MHAKEMERALSGLDYPATRNKLITKARENRASQEVIARLHLMMPAWAVAATAA